MKHFIKNLLTTKSNESKAAFTLRADRDRRRYARCHKTSAGRQPMTTRCLVTWKISIYIDMWRFCAPRYTDIYFFSVCRR